MKRVRLTINSEVYAYIERKAETEPFMSVNELLAGALECAVNQEIRFDPEKEALQQKLQQQALKIELLKELYLELTRETGQLSQQVSDLSTQVWLTNEMNEDIPF